MLKFWGEMAEVSVQHLKPHDLIYVSGSLGSYLEAFEDGSSLRYEVHSATSHFLVIVGFVCLKRSSFESFFVMC